MAAALALQGRYVTVLKHGGQLYCLDSICFHAGGPLALGDIEDIHGQPCLRCPWHYYRVAIDTGEKFYHGTVAEADTGRLLPGPWKRWAGQARGVSKQGALAAAAAAAAACGSAFVAALVGAHVCVSGGDDSWHRCGKHVSC